VDGATIKSVSSYFAVYILCMVAVFLVLSLEPAPFDLETNLSASIACFNNIGPGFGLVGPAANFAAYSPLSKLVLSLAMLMGRLEIYPLLLTLSPATWIKK
jgi:trk system potassium uptake protein TrkH